MTYGEYARKQHTRIHMHEYFHKIHRARSDRR
jgi:hypothetical protein